MTIPPQPGPWNAGGQQPPQQPPPGYYPPQQAWGPPPPKQNNTIKWLLVGVGVLLVIAITVGVTVLVTRGGSGGDGPSTSTSASGPPIASADDDGPVEIITIEPTCQAWVPLSSTLSQVQGNGWGDRDPSIPASDWTPAVKTQYEDVAKAMKATAEQTIALATETPNRVVRQVYQQFIYYSEAYADSISRYSARDDSKALAVVAASITLDSLCQSITYGSAVSGSSTTAPAPDPTAPSANDGTPNDPQPLVSRAEEGCSLATKQSEQLVTDFAEWSKQDPRIPGNQWSEEQRSAAENASTAMRRFADAMESIGKDAKGLPLQDLAYFAAVYSRAYAASLRDYKPADNFLLIAGTRANNIIVSACEVAG